MDPRAQRRLRGFREACAGAGVLDELRIVTTPQPSSVGMGRRLLETLFAQAPDTDSVLCNNDDLAVGSLMEAKARNIAVPDALGICSFNDVEMARHMVPSITAISTPRQEIGQRAIRDDYRRNFQSRHDQGETNRPWVSIGEKRIDPLPLSHLFSNFERVHQASNFW